MSEISSNPIASKRDCCRLCESKDLALAVPLKPTPVSEKYLDPGSDEEIPLVPLDLYQCQGCGHLQLLDVVDESFLYSDYTYRSGQNHEIVVHFEELAQGLLEKMPLGDDSLIIDIGSNDGTLLQHFRKAGCRVLGIDPAEEIAKEATEAGVETIPDFFTGPVSEKIASERGKADLIFAFNVFAHGDSLGGMLDAIKGLLKDDGTFVFEVSYLGDVVEKMLLGTIFHEHMSYHAVAPLQTFLDRHGMKLIGVERAPVQGGSIVCRAVHADSSVEAEPSVGAMLEEERASGLNGLERMRQFADQLADLRGQVKQFVDTAAAEGKTIAGFGAARSGTTLICQMDLGEAIQFVVDNHPQKTGKLSPANKIPIEPVDAIYEKRPDYLVILAWIHAARIIESNRRYLDEGVGKFVNCVPELVVVEEA